MKIQNFKTIIDSQNVRLRLSDNLGDSAMAVIKLCFQNNIVLACNISDLRSIALWEVDDAFEYLNVQTGPNYSLHCARKNQILHDLFTWQQNHDDSDFGYHPNFVAGYRATSAYDMTSYIVSSGTDFYHVVKNDSLLIKIDDFYTVATLVHLFTLAYLGY